MSELDKLPLYEFHTMYYRLWKEKDEESNLSEEEKGGRALGRMIEDIT